MPDRRLNGYNPLSYLGTNPYTPSDTIVHTFDPTPTDWQNFELGTFWLNSTTNYLWILVNLDQNIATWQRLAQIILNTSDPTTSSPGTLGEFWLNTVGYNLWILVNITGIKPSTYSWVMISEGSSGTLDNLKTSEGNVVTPTLGQIILANGANITTTGTVGPNTVTISVSGTTNHTLQLGNSAGSLTSLGVATNGQLPIGSTGADPVLATLTGGTGISITNGAGSITISASGIVDESFVTDSGTATPSSNAINIITDNAANNAGATVLFSGTGSTVTLNVTNTTSGNTLIGSGVGNLSSTGTSNTVMGYNSLSLLTSGNSNTAIGVGCLAVTSGSGNQSFGEFSLSKLTTGDLNDAFGLNTGWNGTTGLVSGNYNILIGSGSSTAFNAAGSSYTGSESSNILIRNTGTTGESNVLRIGQATGTGPDQLNATYIAGIFGNTVNVGTGTAVFIDSTGLLGTIVSSLRYKENVKNMDDASSKLMNLRPVTFNFKKDENKNISYGLIAEEVAEDFPELSVIQGGEPLSVKYHDLPVLLLNELQKLSKRVQELEAKLNQ